MKVKELIDVLENCDPEMEVHIQYNYGDHWRTQVAPKVDSISEEFVKFSDYHRMHKVIEVDYDDEDEATETLQRVLVIG